MVHWLIDQSKLLYLEEWLNEDNTDENQSKYNVYVYKDGEIK